MKDAGGSLFCWYYRRQMIAYLEESLAPQRRSSLSRHFATCDDCRMELRSLQQMIGSVRQATPPAPPPAKDLWSRLEPRLHPAPPAPRRAYLLPTATLAAAVACVVGYVLLPHPSMPTDTAALRQARHPERMAALPASTARSGRPMSLALAPHHAGPAASGSAGPGSAAFDGKLALAADAISPAASALSAAELQGRHKAPAASVSAPVVTSEQPQPDSPVWSAPRTPVVLAYRAAEKDEDALAAPTREDQAELGALADTAPMAVAAPLSRLERDTHHHARRERSRVFTEALDRVTDNPANFVPPALGASQPSEVAAAHRPGPSPAGRPGRPTVLMADRTAVTSADAGSFASEPGARGRSGAPELGRAVLDVRASRSLGTAAGVPAAASLASDASASPVVASLVDSVVQAGDSLRTAGQLLQEPAQGAARYSGPNRGQYSAGVDQDGALLDNGTRSQYYATGGRAATLDEQLTLNAPEAGPQNDLLRTRNGAEAEHLNAAMSPLALVGGAGTSGKPGAEVAEQVALFYSQVQTQSADGKPGLTSQIWGEIQPAGTVAYAQSEWNPGQENLE